MIKTIRNDFITIQSGNKVDVQDKLKLKIDFNRTVSPEKYLDLLVDLHC